MNDLVKAEIQAENEDAQSTLEIVRNLPSVTPEDLGLLNDVLIQVRDKTKAVEARRSEILDPLNSSIKAIRALFSPVLDTLGEMESVIRGKVTARALAQREADNAARALAVKAAQAGDSQAATVALAQVQVTRDQGLGNLAVTYGWEGAIEDFDKIPREWLAVDWSKVKIHCKNYAKSEAIPPVAGLKFQRTAGTRAK